tara:strand:+ start:12773 stop:13708 length:936 start_codon:yes stop_codon:yes gene_type:complete
MIINTNPEFGYELACSIPYAYWLHQQGKLEKVITCKNMKPFYYFCDNVEEKYNVRSIDNRNNGVQNLPNDWVHHNALAVFGKDYSLLSEKEKTKANGVLDYRKWTPPPLHEVYYDNTLDLPKKYIVVSNAYNLEHNQSPLQYFDIESLYNIFNILTDKGYNIIYKRPKNIEFAIDPNEWQGKDIKANVEGIGEITDFQLTNHYDNIMLLDDVVNKIGGSYNEAQLKIFARAEGFIARGGGSSILCSYFKKPVIIYVCTSGDIRPGYFDKNTYFQKISNNNVHAVIDPLSIIKERGYRDYSEVYLKIKKFFK